MNNFVELADPAVYPALLLGERLEDIKIIVQVRPNHPKWGEFVGFLGSGLPPFTITMLTCLRRTVSVGSGGRDERLI